MTLTQERVPVIQLDVLEQSLLRQSNIGFQLISCTICKLKE